MLASRRLVVTGTDTEVGKTWVGCRLAEALRDGGAIVRAVKPLESGCAAGEPDPGEDGVLLARAAGQASPGAALVRLVAPVAPPVAAEREGRALDWEALVRSTREAVAGAQVALVEGAGGLLSPLTWDHTAVDLAKALEAEVLVVAPDKLGVINHVRLTLAALRAAGLTCPGVVLSAPEIADAATGANAASLGRLPEVPAVWSAARGGGAAELARALYP